MDRGEGHGAEAFPPEGATGCPSGWVGGTHLEGREDGVVKADVHPADAEADPVGLVGL